MVDKPEDMFPALQPGNHRITSPSAKRYNCIAWAASDALNWWWPVSDGRTHWPASVPLEETLDAFVKAFATMGYTECDSDELEAGFEKIAIFADKDSSPRHAARQLASGLWTSKLGEREDIEHRLRDLEGDLYGVVSLIMKRPRL